MVLPYSIDEIQDGLREPYKAKRELSELTEGFKHTLVNAQKRWDQRDKSSRYGLVLNWGLHQSDNWTAACYPVFVERFIKRFDPVVITGQREYDRRAEELEHIFAFGVRNKKGPTLEYDINLNQTVLMFASDPHDRSEYLHDYIRENEIDYVLTPFYNPFLYHIPGIDEERLVHFPWPVPDKHIINPDAIEYHGDEAVHISGASGSGAYELRDWCRNHPDVAEHANSGTQNKTMTNSEYYMWLRNFDASIAAGSLCEQWQYVVPKYYEIPAAGSLLFAQYCEDLDRLGFDDSNCIVFHSKEDFKKKIEAYLDAPEEYLERRKNGAGLIASEYSISDRLDNVEALFEDQLTAEYQTIKYE